MAIEFIQSVDASVLVDGKWHAINWQTITGNVRRLQARIVKATKEGKWRKVKALQYLLTHSFSGKALAVRRVTENDGFTARTSLCRNRVSHRALPRLEPCAVKVASTVLRGGDGGNAISLTR
jgi:hypothetical protein